MRILFVCTGNMCRSPIAERLTTAWASDRLGSAADAVCLDSAGTDAHDGQPMDARSAQALSELGGDPEGFTSRLLTRREAEQFDLVLTMSRRHRHAILKRAPRALRHTFTLPEAASLLTTSETSGISDLPLSDRAGELAVRLNAARARRRTVAEDDVPDPIGRAIAEHRNVARSIADNLQSLMDVLLSPPPFRVAPHPPGRALPVPPVPPPAPLGASPARRPMGPYRATAGA